MKDIKQIIKEYSKEINSTLKSQEKKFNMKNNERSKSVVFSVNEINEKIKYDENKKKGGMNNQQKNKSFNEKLIEDQVKQRKNIEILKNKISKENNDQYCMKPKIDKKSEKLAKFNKPIYERVNEIVGNKISKIEKIKQDNDSKRKIEEDSIFSNSVPTSNYNEKRFDAWTKSQFDWKEKKENKLKERKLKQAIEENNNLKTMHHPKINKKSEKIAITKLENAEFPTFQRLFYLQEEIKEKHEKIRDNELPTFTPNINTNFVKFQGNQKISRNKQNNNLKYSKKKISHSIEFIPDVQLVKTHLNSSISNNHNYQFNSNTEHFSDGDIEILSNSKFESDKKVRRKKKVNISWQQEILKVKNSDTSETECNTLYKINVRNSSVWNKNNENEIVLRKRLNLRI